MSQPGRGRRLPSTDRHQREVGHGPGGLGGSDPGDARSAMDKPPRCPELSGDPVDMVSAAQLACRPEKAQSPAVLWGPPRGPQGPRGGTWPPWHGYFGPHDYMLLYLDLPKVPGVDYYMRLGQRLLRGGWVGGHAGSPLCVTKVSTRVIWLPEN